MLNNFQEKIKLIHYNIQLWKYHIKEPDQWTLWYWILRSRSLYRFRIFIYIIWFFSSLFYIEFIRV
jgi:hypothetical protein